MKILIYIVCGMLNLIINITFVFYWLAGSHGKIQFRPHMFGDWLFLSATLSWFILALIFFILAYQSFKSKHGK